MGVFMNGSKELIKLRGKEGCQTPIGRALFSFFIRSDMQSSVVTGNPMFLDEQWWKCDPLYDPQIPQEAPILLAADSALTKLCVIVAKITLVKRSAALRRKRILHKLEKGTSSPAALERSSLKTETQIRQQVTDLQKELANWHRALPTWFNTLEMDQMTEGEEDINRSEEIQILPQRYPHHSIAVVQSIAYAANLQLWRIANPEEMNPPSWVGAVVHAVFRAFLATPETSDAMTISNVWIAALFLRHQSHRQWLENIIMLRIQNSNFWCWKFAFQGIQHQWAQSDGLEIGRFKLMPEGATEVVDGVSENLWRADGVMSIRLADLAHDDTDILDGQGPRMMYRFEGDTPLFTEDEFDDDEGTAVPEKDNWTTPPQEEFQGFQRIPLKESFIDDY
jgi:Fungal specific transcription factor domain